MERSCVLFHFHVRRSGTPGSRFQPLYPFLRPLRYHTFSPLHPLMLFCLPTVFLYIAWADSPPRISLTDVSTSPQGPSLVIHSHHPHRITTFSLLFLYSASAHSLTCMEFVVSSASAFRL